MQSDGICPKHSVRAVNFARVFFKFMSVINVSVYYFEIFWTLYT